MKNIYLFFSLLTLICSCYNDDELREQIRENKQNIIDLQAVIGEIAAPVLKIEDGYLFVSYDKGTSWERVGAISNQVTDCKIEDAVVSAGYVRITLTGGDTFEVPLLKDNVKSYYLEELGKTKASVYSLMTEPCIVFPMITDIHYKDSPQCPDLIDNTIDNIVALSKDIRFDFFITLGDIVDGSVPKDSTEKQVKYLLEQFRRIDAPYYPCIGNHEDNRYYGDGTSIFSHEDLYRIYLRNGISDVIYDMSYMCGTNYYKDIHSFGIRFIFINGSTNGKYGFSDETCEWFENAVKTNYDIYVFSHISPVKSHQYNQGTQLNGDRITAAIKGASTFKMFFNGHSHFDCEFTAPFNNDNPFLSYTLTCNKFSNDARKATWPSHASQPTRKLNTASEDCFDIVIIRPMSQKVNTVRFGAGVDKEFDLLSGSAVVENPFASGSGTEDDPYVVRTVEHWKNIATYATSRSYYKIGDNIDFLNSKIEPIVNFGGILDGNGFTLSNARIGDGTSSHQAFFYNLTGIVKNLQFDNITVSASSSTATGNASTSAGVIAAGNNENAFTLENCHVKNSFVSSGKEGDTYGAYAGGLVARAKNAGVLIRNCSVRNTTVTTLTQNAGGLIGVFSNGTIDSSVSSGNIINSDSQSGGVAGSVGPNATLINCVSENNVCAVNTYGAGGVVGANAWNSISSGEYPQFVNILSVGNTVKSLRVNSSKLLVGLIVGGRETNDNNMVFKNCFVASGSTQYSYTVDTNPTYPNAACVGIMIGYGAPSIEHCSFNETLRHEYDAYLYANTTRTDGKEGGWYRNAVGIKQSVVTSDSKGGTSLDGITSLTEISLTDGTALKYLNDWVSSNKSSYQNLKSWISDQSKGGIPTINMY